MTHFIKNIYIVRHGQTDFNRLGIVQGSGINAPLNQTGHEQAAAFYAFYKHINFDKIYTSTLIRTQQTVKKFIENGISWEQHEGLNEISWGNREGKLPDAEDNIQFAQITAQWNNGQTSLKFDAGESPQEVAERQKKFWDYLIDNEHEKNVLIAMHGRALKILLAHLIHQDLSKMDEFEHTNLCLYQLTYNYENQSLSLVEYNNTNHLKQR
jgi:2,3-bisphosphoglycerate-dependent phosphoglycerate mutase